MDLEKPFIRLPYSFDVDRLQTELNALDANAWMAHPSGMRGNTAVALVSRDGGDNNLFDGPMRPTPHLARCPYIQQIMSAIGEVYGRSRLMRLAGGSEVSSHIDFNYHWYTRVRIHIPVITNSQVTFCCGDEQLHMQAGECWIFDSWRRHQVVNASQESRTHLVLDTAGSSRFWRTVRHMANYTGTSEQDPDKEKIRYIPYEPAKSVQVLTENYNIAPVMSPGELDALIQVIIDDFKDNPKNNPELVSSYMQLLGDFAKDWRETWHLFGYQKDGWPHYKKLIDGIFAKLHPDRRALVTSSNGLGVNPVVVQRVLRSALATDQFEEFVSRQRSKE